MSDIPIYYYTSDNVLKAWLESETLWATRSVTSNDNEDTIHMANLFDLFNALNGNKYSTLLEEIKNYIYASKYFSKKTIKDLLLYYIEKDPCQFAQSVNQSIKNYEYVKTDFIKADFSKIDFIDKDENGIPYIRGNEFLEFLFKDISQHLTDLELNDIFSDRFINSKCLNEFCHMFFPFVICFTYLPDNRFLWDSYTNNKGVCLEFSQSELIEYLRNKYPSSKFISDNYCNIEYDVNKQIKWLLEALEVLERKETISKAEFLSFNFAFFKDYFWKPENEFRLAFAVKYFNDVRFKVQENYNLKYKNKCLTQDYIRVTIPKSLLKSVTLGPSNEEDLYQYSKYINDRLEKSITVASSCGKGMINNRN